PRPTSSLFTLSLHDALPIWVWYIFVQTPSLKTCKYKLSLIRFPLLYLCKSNTTLPSVVFSLTMVKFPEPQAPALFINTNKTKTRSEEHTSELQSRENLVCRL